LAQFNIEAKDSIRIIDKVNEVNIISLLIWWHIMKNIAISEEA
jgi:hypothetical protein